MSYIARKSSYYVYQCTVDGVVRYVGMGIGDRWLHCIQGKSSCKRLNRDLFIGRHLDVEIKHEGLTKAEAMRIERDLIKSMPDQLYNTAENSRPYVEASEEVLTNDSPSHLLWERLQAVTMQVQECRLQIEQMHVRQREAIWVKTLNLKKGKDDQKLTTYLLMLENQKLTKRLVELEAAQSAKQ